LLFDYFATLTDNCVKKAKRQGKFDQGITKLEGRSVDLSPSEVVVPATKMKTALLRTDISQDRGYSFEEARTKLAEATAEDAAAKAAAAESAESWGGMRGVGGQRRNRARSVNGFWLGRNRNVQRGYRLTLCAVEVQSASAIGHWGKCRVFRPETGSWEFNKEDVFANYNRIETLDEAKQVWDKAFATALTVCSHGPRCKHGAACQVGKRVQQKCVLGGNVLDNWSRIETEILNVTGNSTVKLKIVRANSTAPGGEVRDVVGLELPGPWADDVCSALQDV